VIQRVGKANWIFTFDLKGAYLNIPVKPEHQWLTAFVWDEGLYEFTRAPYGQKGSGYTFVRVLQQNLQPIKEFAESYVDDISVFSDLWQSHLAHIEKFLQVIKDSGFVLNLKKTSLAQSQVKFLGHIIGSGQRKANPDKVRVVHEMKRPENKKQVRQVLGFFFYFRHYVPNFSAVAKPLTDLTGKRLPDHISWVESQEQAFQTLKAQLCLATTKALSIVDFKKPFTLHVHTSDHTVAAVLTQITDEGTEQPVAFASNKLNKTQWNWSVVEKEAYAAIWTLKKFGYRTFGKRVTVYTDHSPITFLTESVPKSAKLMRWSLALQNRDVVFRCKTGKQCCC